VSTQQAETYQIIYRLINLYTPHVTAENHQALISPGIHITEYWQYISVYKLLLTDSHSVQFNCMLKTSFYGGERPEHGKQNYTKGRNVFTELVAPTMG
jgi:hypothetical protein